MGRTRNNEESEDDTEEKDESGIRKDLECLETLSDSEIESDAEDDSSESEYSVVSSRSSSPSSLRICGTKRLVSSSVQKKKGLSPKIETPLEKVPLQTHKRRHDDDDLEKIPTGPESKRSRPNILPDKGKKMRTNRRRRRTSKSRRRHNNTTKVQELDSEIDKLLEHKAIKNNLTATNVKSLIRHVITNNMVQKMRNSDDDTSDEEDDDETCRSPRLTRAKTKLLLGKGGTNSNTSLSSPLWQICSSPAVKSCPPETQVLLEHDLPEDSSCDDEEYVPETHSEGEFSSSVVASGSDPRLSSDLLSSPVENLSQEIPSSPGRVESSTIGQRTRSKQPLNDTPLENLEDQLIPPDVTEDMYDWGTIEDEDYLGFINEFLRPSKNVVEGDDEEGEEADPEYNVMADVDAEEEVQDREELRNDRAVSVSKKELNHLLVGLFEGIHFPSDDEGLDEAEYNNQEPSISSGRLMENGGIEVVPETDDDVGDVTVTSPNTNLSSKTVQLSDLGMTNGSLQLLESDCESSQRLEPCSSRTPKFVAASKPRAMVLPRQLSQENRDPSPPPAAPPPPVEEQEDLVADQPVNLSSEAIRSILAHQLRQHVQLLAQSYALTATREEDDMQAIAEDSKRMIIEISNINTSIISNVHNCEAAFQLVHSWPVGPCSSSRSPNQENILLDMINCNKSNWKEDSGGRMRRLPTNYFPRHVLKAIAESDAFIFPNLLPIMYDQKSEKRCGFLPSEDKLIILGLDRLKCETLSCMEKAVIIAGRLLASRTPESVYHRIRNQKKKMNAHSSQCLKDYFEFGRLPSGATPPPSGWHPVSPIRQRKETLPRMWRRLISSSMLIPEGNTERSKVKNGKSSTRKLNRAKKGDACIQRTFPMGTNMHPDLTAISLKNEEGDAAMYMLVPNYALIEPGSSETSQVDHPVPLYENEGVPDDDQDSPFVFSETSPSRQFYLPVPFYTENNAANDDEKLVTLTPLGIPITLSGLDGDFVDFSSLNTPLKMAVMEQMQVSESDFAHNYEESEDQAGGNNEIINAGVNSVENMDDVGIKSENEADFVPSNQDLVDRSYESECEDNSYENEPPVVITSDEVEVSSSSPVDANENINDDQGKQSNNNNEKNSSAASSSEEIAYDDTIPSGGEDSSNRDNGNNRDGDDDEDGGSDDVSDDDEVDEEEEDDDDTDIEDTDEELEEFEIKQNPTTRSCEPGPSSQPAKRKTSPSSSPQNKKRIAIESSTLEEDDYLDHQDEDVCDAFMSTFLHKIQLATESNHPHLHAEFIALITEAGSEINISQESLLARVKILFEEYPQLAEEFATFSQTRQEDRGEDDEVKELGEMESQLNLLHHLEKFTETRPQLRAEIMHKFEILKEKDNVTVKDFADALTPLFEANPVMINAFRALTPFLSGSGSVSDIEELDLEEEETTPSDTELVTLPHEKTIPATTILCQKTPSTRPDLQLRRDVEEEDGEILNESEDDDNGVMISSPGDKDVNVNNSVATTGDANCTTTPVDSEAWTYEEDELIISTWKSELCDESAFSKVESLLPNRDRNEIANRCSELLAMFQSMNNNSLEEEIQEENATQE